MTKYVLPLVFLLVGACGPQNPIGPSLPDPPPLKLCESTPLLRNDAYWAEFGGKAAVNCKLTACFPRSLEAPIPCDMRCIMTENGHGQPDVVKHAFDGKKPADARRPPYFIVAYGPPGSGKAGILSFLERSFSEFRELDEAIVSVDVDSIFQGGKVGEQYRVYRQQILQMRAPQAEKEIYLQRLYVYYRWIADQISDQILNLALLGRYHVRWETTGASDWSRHEIARINGYKYKTLVVYPLADTQTLIERVQARAQSEGQEPMPAELVRKTVELAQNNLVDLLPLGHVIVLDNNGEKGKETILFDSARPASYCTLSHKAGLTRSLEDALAAFAKCHP